MDNGCRHTAETGRQPAELPEPEAKFRKRYKKSPAFLTIHAGIRADSLPPGRSAAAGSPVCNTAAGRCCQLSLACAHSSVQADALMSSLCLCCSSWAMGCKTFKHGICMTQGHSLLT